MPKSRFDGGKVEMSLPACSIVPLSWKSRPAMARSRVVFPHPDGPRKQTNSPALMSSEMSLNAWKPPKCLSTLRMRR